MTETTYDDVKAAVSGKRDTEYPDDVLALIERTSYFRHMLHRMTKGEQITEAEIKDAHEALTEIEERTPIRAAAAEAYYKLPDWQTHPYQF